MAHRRHRLKRALVALVIVVGLFAVDQGLRIWIQHGMQRAAADYCGGVASADSVLRAFPFAPRLVAGKVSSLEFQLSGVTTRHARFTQLGIQLSGVEVDQGELLRGRLRVQSVRSGVITARTDKTGLMKNSTFDLRFKGDDATLKGTLRGLLPVDVKGSYALENNALVFHIASIQGLALPLDFTYELPSKGACIEQPI